MQGAHARADARYWEVGVALSDVAAKDEEPAQRLAVDDAELIAAVRDGDLAAYGVLYERHVGAARRAAAALTANRADRDDLVADSFIRVLGALRDGYGPSDTFRAYLLTTLRNSLIDRRRRDSPIALVADAPEERREERHDPIDTRLHAQIAATAFSQLPRRWRLVLWYTEVENRSPGEVAAILSLTPNGVAALAYRAREALRQAYLDQHTPTAPTRTCRPILKRLPAWVRDRTTASDTRRISTHLKGCSDCRALAADLRQLNQQLPSLLAPLVAGTPLALASLAGTAGTLAGTLATVGAFEATGTGMSTGLSIASWTAAAKTVVAGAAVVATTALNPTSLDPHEALPRPPATEHSIGAPTSRTPAPLVRPHADVNHQPLGMNVGTKSLRAEPKTKNGQQPNKHEPRSDRTTKTTKTTKTTAKAHKKASKKAAKKADKKKAKKARKAKGSARKKAAGKTTTKAATTGKSGN